MAPRYITSSSSWPTLLTTILDKIMSGAFISLSISVIITCLIRIWVRFNVTLYKDESYLTHTLPIKRETIYKMFTLWKGIFYAG